MALPSWFRFGSGNRPSSTPLQASVADNKCFSAPSNILAIASNATPANQTAAACIWNAANSGVQLFVYSIVLCSDTAGVKVRLGHVTADPALGTAVTPIPRYRQTSLSTSAVAAGCETSVAGSIPLPTTVTDSFITGIVPIILDDDLSAVWVQPGTGIIVHFNEETASTAVNVAVTFCYAEFSTT